MAATSTSSGSGPGLTTVLASFARSPRETLLRRWNWKSALTSSLVRAALFFAVNLTAGPEAAWAAFFTELIFRACTAGFYGAITQGLSTVRPEWKGTLGACLLLPVFNHSLELAAHWARGTEELTASILASVCFTAVSSMFHCFVMRQGLMTVGEGSQGLLADLAAMPKALALFVASPFQRQLARKRV
ncbi:MAG: hypothetical protein H6509_08310 [Bryobacterales bacterium]|nr:hypothetical protein [Acidobacteriota bacterium]MCB9384604.1 hypothetical protein [Bryobacterales bacterium]